MKKENRKPLIDHIREVLQDHEEPYVLGSWERFQHYSIRKSKIRIKRTAFSAAAAILLVFTFLFAWNRLDHIEPEQYVAEQPADSPEIAEPEASSSSHEEDELSVIERKVDLAGETEVEKVLTDEPVMARNSDPTESLEALNSEILPSITTRTVTYQAYTVSRMEITPAIIDKPERVASDTERSGRTRNSQSGVSHPEVPSVTPLVRPSDVWGAAARSEKKDIAFSLAYAPLMNMHESQTDWAFGGGFLTDWNFTDKIALSSGLFIAQNQLKYRNEHESLTRLAENNTMESTPGDLVSMQVDLVSLEIPLSFRYFLTESFSVSAGISSVAYLKENFDYTYEYQQQIQIFEVSETTGLQPMTRVVTLTESQKQSEPSLNAMDVAAFYTFTVDYQYDVTDRHTVSFEPFFKIPTGQLTSRDIQYTSGGLQLKIHF